VHDLMEGQRDEEEELDQEQGEDRVLGQRSATSAA